MASCSSAPSNPQHLREIFPALVWLEQVLTREAIDESPYRHVLNDDEWLPAHERLLLYAAYGHPDRGHFSLLSDSEKDDVNQLLVRVYWKLYNSRDASTSSYVFAEAVCGRYWIPVDQDRKQEMAYIGIYDALDGDWWELKEFQDDWELNAMVEHLRRARE